MQLTLDQHEELHQLLNHNIHHRFSMINQGGCGFFAHLMSLSLEALNIEHQVHFVYNRFHCNDSKLEDLAFEYECNDDTNSVSNAILDVIAGDSFVVTDKETDEVAADMPNSHIVIVIDGTIYDSRGNITNRYDIHGDALTSETLERMVLCNDVWNDTFQECHGEEVGNIGAHLRDCFKQLQKLLATS